VSGPMTLSRPIPSSGGGLVVKPPRHNFAGYCIMCDGLGCQSSLCAESYAGTVWGVCLRCDGRGYDELDRPCICVFGVVELDDRPCDVTVRCAEPNDPQCRCPECRSVDTGLVAVVVRPSTALVGVAG